MRDSAGYGPDWYDVNGNVNIAWPQPLKKFSVTVGAKAGDLYFQVDTYYRGMIPKSCFTENDFPTVSIFIVKKPDGTSVTAYCKTSYCMAYVPEASYSAGATFTIQVQYNWKSLSNAAYSTPDYTVSVYSTQMLTVVDESGGTSNLNFDGTSPSGFTASSVVLASNPSLVTPVHPEEWQKTQYKVTSLTDLFTKTKGKSLSEFFRYFWNNTWVMFKWFD